LNNVVAKVFMKINSPVEKSSAFTTEELIGTVVTLMFLVAFFGYGKSPAITGGVIGAGAGFVIGVGFGIVAAGDGINGGLIGALFGMILGISIGNTIADKSDDAPDHSNQSSQQVTVDRVLVANTEINEFTRRGRTIHNTPPTRDQNSIRIQACTRKRSLL